MECVESTILLHLRVVVCCCCHRSACRPRIARWQTNAAVSFLSVSSLPPLPNLVETTSSPEMYVEQVWDGEQWCVVKREVVVSDRPYHGIPGRHIVCASSKASMCGTATLCGKWISSTSSDHLFVCVLFSVSTLVICFLSVNVDMFECHCRSLTAFFRWYSLLYDAVLFCCD